MRYLKVDGWCFDPVIENTVKMFFETLELADEAESDAYKNLDDMRNLLESCVLVAYEKEHREEIQKNGIPEDIDFICDGIMEDCLKWIRGNCQFHGAN